MSGINLSGIFENPSNIATCFQCLIPYRLDVKTIALTCKNWNQAIVTAEKEVNYTKNASLINFIIKNLKIDANIANIKSLKTRPEGKSLFEVQASTLKKTVQIAMWVHSLCCDEKELLERRNKKDSPYAFKSVIETDLLPILKSALIKYESQLKDFESNLQMINKNYKQNVLEFNFLGKKILVTRRVGYLTSSIEPLINKLCDYAIVNAPFLTPSERNILIHSVFIRTIPIDDHRYRDMACTANIKFVLTLGKNFDAFKDLFLDSSHWINYLERASLSYKIKGDLFVYSLLKKFVNLGRSEKVSQTNARMDVSRKPFINQKTSNEAKGDEYVRQARSLMQRSKMDVSVQPSLNQKIFDDLGEKFQMYLISQSEEEEYFFEEALNSLSVVSEKAKNTFIFNLIYSLGEAKISDKSVIDRAELIIQAFISDSDINSICLSMIDSLRPTTSAKNPSINSVIAKDVNTVTTPISTVKSEPSIQELITDKLYSEAVEKINLLSDRTERRFALYALADAIGAFDNLALDPYNDISDVSVRLIVLKFYFTILVNKGFETRNFDSKTRQETFMAVNLITDETIRTTLFTNLAQFFFPDHVERIILFSSLEESSERLELLNDLF